MLWLKTGTCGVISHGRRQRTALIRLRKSARVKSVKSHGSFSRHWHSAHTGSAGKSGGFRSAGLIYRIFRARGPGPEIPRFRSFIGSVWHRKWLSTRSRESTWMCFDKVVVVSVADVTAAVLHEASISSSALTWEIGMAVSPPVGCRRFDLEWLLSWLSWTWILLTRYLSPKRSTSWIYCPWTFALQFEKKM